MKKARRISAYVIMIFILNLFSGCKNIGENDFGSNKNPMNIVSGSISYTSVELDAPMRDLHWESIDSSNGSVYFLKENTIYKSISGSDTSKADILYASESDIASICACTEGIWIIENEDGTYRAKRLDINGIEQTSADITSYLPEGNILFMASTDKDGSLYIAASGTDQCILHMINQEGSFIASSKTSGFILDIATGGDGSIYVLFLNSQGLMIRSLNSAGGWDNTLTVALDIKSLEDGDEKYTIYCGDNLGFYGVNAAKNEATRLFYWTDVNLGGKLPAAAISMRDSSFLFYTDTLLYQVTPAEESDARTILKLASYNPNSDIVKLVNDYNAANTEYRIEITDYKQYNTSPNGKEGLQRLQTEITAGQLPDIFDLSSYYLPTQLYIKKGILLDLYPYLDNDPDLNRDCIFEGILSAYERNGALYEAPSSFTLTCFIGIKEVVGETPGWQMDDMLSLLESMPSETEGILGQNKEQMLVLLSLFAFDDYIDWDTGVCTFESESFISLLKYLAVVPDISSDYDPERLKNKEALLLTNGISSIFSISAFRAFFGDSYVIKGFPVQNGSGNYFTKGGSVLGISSTCKNKDAAWSFVRNMFTEEFENNQRMIGLPVSIAAFEKLAERKLSFFQNDQAHEETVLLGNQQVIIKKPAEDDITLLVDLINSCDRAMNNNEVVASIVKEECGAYFAGDKSAEETARVIQSRVNTYINEQR
ncbi:MAG: extracellular solute-binding protein [Clostridiales bacterium]|nr:extracellular solute-binding protein [Clostridiales bacterium]